MEHTPSEKEGQDVRGPASGRPSPSLSREVRGDLAFWSDPLLINYGVRVAFSERNGGVSRSPFESLNLASHVGDVPANVAENRRRLLDALQIGGFASSLTMAEQVHGDAIARVQAPSSSVSSGKGASTSPAPAVVPATDALITTVPGVPLLMCFADCVPVVLVAPGPAVSVVHAGWRGVLARLPGLAAAELARVAACPASGIRAYIGAYIGPSHFEVGDDVLSQFSRAFGTFSRAESGRLDLGAIVHATLTDAGVPPCSIASLGVCTAEETDRYFSYRAEGGRTGRHGALVCILP